VRLHKENLIKEMAPKPKQSSGPPMTLGNMRELGRAPVLRQRIVGPGNREHFFDLSLEAFRVDSFFCLRFDLAHAHRMSGVPGISNRRKNLAG
jgi:hypothetical protein